MGSDTPYRIDLFDDRIESIRRFDPDSQRTTEKLDRVQLLPGREFPLTRTAIQTFRQRFRERFEGDPQKVPLYRDVSQGLSPAGIEYYLPLFHERMETLFEYLPAATLVVSEDGFEQSAKRFLAEAEERYERLRHDRERPLLPPSELFIAPEHVSATLAAQARVLLTPFNETPTTVPDATSSAGTSLARFASETPPLLPVRHKAEQPYAPLFDWLRDYRGRVLLVAETPGRREVLRALLHDHDVYPDPCNGWNEFITGSARLALTVAELEKGLLLPDPAIAIITEPQLYGERAAQRRRRLQSARDPEAVIRNLAELRVNDPVVHEDHGVGRYLGLQTLDVGDGPNEFLTLAYAGGDKLYIPVTDLQKVGRYTGTHPDQAPLHKLGGDTWEKAKHRAREKAHDAAVELLQVQALRAARQGYAFPTRDEQYQGFADAFPFEETPDQARVIDEVLRDMETGRPMDRLVCGDVGFGKTEVALRAAFLAVQGRRQVALLVPTTLLAQQHYQNFSDRFADYPMHVELLSRFRSKAEQDKVLAGLADGGVDIVIGTHRLLQPDIRFKQLGLVIIDEEHRFGVRQKEQLKKLRSQVDILTLTATPVPRTLNMALAAFRDISLITTAPEARLSVKTFVREWNDALVREACLREIRRGGQVYFLHNDVRSMDKALAQLQRLVPEAEIRVAHGQMPERELEQVMLDFYHQRFNILLCSTIIESGIDVPTANTIVIQRADKFGLAQLHQLRGRVGRSHHQAYAYLLVPPPAALSGDAQKRLEAIVSLEELGAGFALASHDLEIRGAGELLGEAQSGQIDEVGFSLYTDLLNRAIASLKAGRDFDFEQPLESGVEINLHVPALFPQDYIVDVHMRLILYKRTAGTRNQEELDDLQAEVIDRFGPLPPAGVMLFRVTALKLKAAALGIRRIEAGPKGARLEFTAHPKIDPATIIQLLQSAPRLYKLDGPNRLRILADLADGDSRIGALQALLERLGPSLSG
jgi:transcription-repair coupling factor (superfamily II helicase)